MKFSTNVMELILKKTWKLSRNSADVKRNIILSIEENGVISSSEIAPNIRYHETDGRAINEIEKFNELIKNESNIDEIIDEIPSSFAHSTQFALESSLLNLKCKLNGTSLCDELEISKPHKIQTSFSLPIMEPEEIEEYLKLNSEYKSYKIKVDEESAIDTVSLVASLTDKKLRIDANEGFSNADTFMKFYEKVKRHNIEFLEQPFKASDIDSAMAVKDKVEIPLIADESIEAHVDFSKIEKCFHGVNVKLMKAGGLKNAVRLLKEAKERNLKTMIGCMIETSLGIKYAMMINSLADYLDLDGHLLIKNDDFNLITKEKGELSIAPPYIV